MHNWLVIIRCYYKESSPLFPALTNPDRRKQLGKTLYHQGELSYFEAVNKETLKNAYTRFEEEGIVLIARSKETRAPPTLRLAPEWTPDRDPVTGELVHGGRLWEFTELIARSRRDGLVFVPSFSLVMFYTDYYDLSPAKIVGKDPR